MEYGIWKQKLVKSYLNKTSVFDTSFENKTTWRVTRLQSKICLWNWKVTRFCMKGRVTGLQYYKRGRITKVFLKERGLSSFWELEPWELEP